MSPVGGAAGADRALALNLKSGFAALVLRTIPSFTVPHFPPFLGLTLPGLAAFINRT